MDMPTIDIRAKIAEKKKATSGKKLVLKDIHRSLIVALTALPVYGKEVRDEEILTIIINGGIADTGDAITRIRDNYNQLVAEKKVKKSKTGAVDTDGYMILVPRV